MSRSSTPVKADATVELIELEANSPMKYDSIECRPIIYITQIPRFLCCS